MRGKYKKPQAEGGAVTECRCPFCGSVVDQPVHITKGKTLLERIKAGLSKKQLSANLTKARSMTSTHLFKAAKAIKP